MLVLLGSLGLQTDAVAPTLGIDVTFVTVVLSSTTLLITFTALVFFVAELNAAREPAFQLTATGEAPRLELARSKRWHLFISHSWANQDAAATIKRQMQLLLPGVRIFLDIDDLDSIEALERHVGESAAMLLFLGSYKYFTSDNCKREVAAAQLHGLPLILAHDADATKNGWPLVMLKAACPRVQRQYVFYERASSADTANGDPRPVIPWHRTRDHQIVSLKLIAEHLLRASPAYAHDAQLSLALPGEISCCGLCFDSPTHVWVSERNEAARSVAIELVSISAMLSLVPAPARATEHERACGRLLEHRGRRDATLPQQEHLDVRPASRGRGATRDGEGRKDRDGARE